MYVVMGSMISGVVMIMDVLIGAVHMLMSVFMIVFVRVGVLMLMRMDFFSVAVLVCVFVSVFVGVQVLVFMGPFHYQILLP